MHCHSKRGVVPRKWMTTKIRAKETAPRERAVSRVGWEFGKTDVHLHASALRSPSHVFGVCSDICSSCLHILCVCLGKLARLLLSERKTHWKTVRKWSPRDSNSRLRALPLVELRHLSGGRCGPGKAWSVKALTRFRSSDIDTVSLACSHTLLGSEEYWEDILAKVAK